MAIPGPFLAGQKLTAGQLNDATQKTIKSIEIGVAGAVYTTSGTTELNMPRFSVGPVSVVNGALYLWNLRLDLQNTVGTDVFNLIIRRTTALTGTVISDWLIRTSSGTVGYSQNYWDDFVSSADESVQYYVSVQRLSGTGTLSVYGQSSTTNRSGIALRRVGYSSEYQVVT